MTIDVHQSITTIVKSLFKWDQITARSQIETKLHRLPENEHNQALLTLDVELSSKAQSEKLQFITNWAPKSIGQLTAQGDLRTRREKEMQDAIVHQRSNPAFALAVENIRNMLPSRKERTAAFTTEIRSGKFYHGSVWKKIFADTRGPLIAIQDLENHLNGIAETERHQAILDWPPK